MDWPEVVDAVADWYEKTAATADAVRAAVGATFTSAHVGYYADPATLRVGVYAPQGSADAAMGKAAASAAADPVLSLSYHDLADPSGTWVKVAYSDSLRRAGELLNFFPGQYPGGIPNAPSPVAAMLTSGLLGAGAGWAGGRLLGKLLPGEYGKNLGRTGAVLGGLVGAAPGAAWGGTNRLLDRPFNEPGLLRGVPGGEPVDFPVAVDGANAAVDPGETGGRSRTLEQIRETLETAPARKLKFGEDVAGVALGRRYLGAAEKVASAFGAAYARPPHPADVNIDRLGRTLWEADAPPALAATTMAGLYAAQQMPDPDSRPGWATGHQLGQLAANAAGDYARGYLVGAALNAVVGTPHRPSAFGAGAVALGVIGTVVPRLFGG